VLPQAVVWISGLVVLAGAAMAVVGAFHTGISWDEPFHVMRLRNYFAHGWFSLDWAVGKNDTTSGDNNTLVYGPVAMLVLHGFAALLGVEGWHTVSTTPHAYDIRHLGVVIIGLIGTGAAAAITRILLGSWRWALFTAAALLALPMWTGHMMFNIKDVPVATGYTLMTLALVSMVAPVKGHRALRILGLTGGIVLMVGTRPAMATAVVAGVVVLAAGVSVAGRFGNRRTALLEVGGALTIAAAVLVAIYPNLYANPANLISSAQQSASFRDGTDASWGYVPFFVAVQVPLLLLGFSLVGIASSLRFVRSSWRTDTSQAIRLVLVGTQLFALPLVAVAKHSDLYNALRQLLFASPAWAVLATVGVAVALRRAQDLAPERIKAGRKPRVRLIGVAAGLALLAPVAAQATQFPYQYAYYNLSVDALGLHVPTDYWRVSVPALLPQIPTDGQIVCGPTRSSTLGALAGTPGTNGIAESALVAGRYSSDSSVDCRTDPLGPLAPSWSADGLSLTDALPSDEFYAVIDRNHAVPANCTKLASVNRNRDGRTVSETYVARCHLSTAPLGTAPVAFTRTVVDGNMIPAKWAYAPEGWVMRETLTALDSAGPTAELAFAPASCGAASCSLLIDGDAPADLIATLNGTTVSVRATHGSLTLPLPGDVSDAWITFHRSSGKSLDLRVRSLRLIPNHDT
jgi:hypothetical protein